jgi:virulence factor Mce-like protein
MGTKPPRPAAIATAVAFVLSCIGFLLLVWLQFGGNLPLQAKGYRMHTLLGLDAVNLASNSDVRISGVNVGKVIATTVQNGRVNAELEIDKKYVPLPADARVMVRTKTLIGETFLEVTPGDRNGPKIPDGGTLPYSHAGRAVGIDEVLAEFDAPTRRDFKKMLTDLSLALRGRGEDLNVFWGSVGPAFDSLNRLVEILDAQRPQLESLVRDTGIAFRAMAARRAELQSLVTAGEDVLATTGARNRELTETVRELPPFLAALRGSLRSLETTADVAAPTLRVLRPAAPLLRPSLDGVNRLTPQLTGVFRELRPVTRASRKGLPALTRVVDEVRPLIDTLDPAGREIVPLLQMFTAYTQELITSFGNTAAGTNFRIPGRAGQPVNVLRLLPPFGNENIVGYTQRPGSNRYNALLAPGGLAKLAGGDFEAFDCRNTSNPTPVPVTGTGAPPCRQQAPWTFQGQMRSYPHVERAR